jgi:hypothetical protein
MLGLFIVWDDFLGAVFLSGFCFGEVGVFDFLPPSSLSSVL